MYARRNANRTETSDEQITRDLLTQRDQHANTVSATSLSRRKSVL